MRRLFRCWLAIVSTKVAILRGLPAGSFGLFIIFWMFEIILVFVPDFFCGSPAVTVIKAFPSDANYFFEKFSESVHSILLYLSVYPNLCAGVVVQYWS